MSDSTEQQVYCAAGGTFCLHIVGLVLLGTIGMDVGTIGFMIAMGCLVPACGCFGVVNQDKNLLMCFCCCSCCGIVETIYGVYVIFVAIPAMKAQMEDLTGMRMPSHPMDGILTGLGVLSCLGCPLHVVGALSGSKLSNEVGGHVRVAAPPLGPPTRAERVQLDKLADARAAGWKYETPNVAVGVPVNVWEPSGKAIERELDRRRASATRTSLQPKPNAFNPSNSPRLYGGYSGERAKLQSGARTPSTRTPSPSASPRPRNTS